MVLRRAAVALVWLVLVAGCGFSSRHQECPPDASCAAPPCDTLLAGRRLSSIQREPQRTLPPVIGSRQVTFSCGDAPIAMQVLRGIPASVAVFREGMAYVGLDTVLRSSRNPMQRYFYPRANGVPKTGCKPRVAVGKIVGVDPFYGVVTLSTHRRLSVATDTELRTPVVDGVPRLPEGLKVKARALSCHGRKIWVARTITQS
jgi:hypothetical protein